MIPEGNLNQRIRAFFPYSYCGLKMGGWNRLGLHFFTKVPGFKKPWAFHRSIRGLGHLKLTGKPLERNWESATIDGEAIGGLEHCLFSHSVRNVVIPFDFHIFQRGRLNHQPDIIYIYIHIYIYICMYI